MGDKSKIEWTDSTWNPVTGCTKVSQGCKHCYAETMAERMWAKQYPSNADGTPRKFTDIRLHEDRLDMPARWKTPRRIFVNSMSDLFHERVPDEFVYRVFKAMADAPWHTFQVLTKRAHRMPTLVNRIRSMLPDRLEHVWLGVSVEDQKAADERIPFLFETRAAVHFLSCEPLLGPIVLAYPCNDWLEEGIDWVICGGESGLEARRMRPEWAQMIRDQCQAACVPFLFKQWGAWSAAGQKVGKKAAGRELDGRTWDEYPNATEGMVTQ